MRLTERPATVRRLADALYRHFADFAAGMGDPPTEHTPDYPWIHQQFVKAWERATAPSSVLGSITAPVATAVVAPAGPLLAAPAATLVQAAPPPPAPAPTRVSARIRARSPAAADKASTKRPRRSATPDSAAPPAKQPRRGRRRQTARANTVASSSPQTPRQPPKGKGKHQEKGKAKAIKYERVPSGSESEGEGQPVASSSKRVSSSKAVPVEKKAGSRRPSKKTAAGEARGPRAHRSGLPLFSPPVYPRGARIPAKKMERVRSAAFATRLLVFVLTLSFFLVHWLSRT